VRDENDGPREELGRAVLHLFHLSLDRAPRLDVHDVELRGESSQSSVPLVLETRLGHDDARLLRRYRTVGGVTEPVEDRVGIAVSGAGDGMPGRGIGVVDFAILVGIAAEDEG